MKLVVQTSSGKYGVGLIDSDGSLMHYLYATESSFISRNVGDLYSGLMQSAKCDISEIDEVIVDLGPGGLSATRCGVSFANAFAYATSTRLYGVSALELLMLDARKVCDLPLVTMRPAPGGLVFWALYLDARAEGFGCSQPFESVRTLVDTYEEIALAGPISRINGDFASLDGVTIYEINPPHLDCFSGATLRPPKSGVDIPILEPISSIEGLTI